MASASQHARHTRYDLHRLDAAEKLASGALRVPARVARVGVLDYSDGQGNTWGELVPEETLFDPSSMGTLRAAACTDLHPGELVTPLTRKGLQVGHVSDVIARDGEYLATAVYITDAEEIRLVQSGERRDVSCGYECELDETPGVFDGRPYQRVQRDRVYNHLGLGPAGWGRAGTDVSLRLDGADERATGTDGASAGRRAPFARLDGADAQTSQAQTTDRTSPGGVSAPIDSPAMTGMETRMAQKITKRDGDEMPPKPEDKDKKDMDAPGAESKKIDSPDLGAQLDAANAALMEAMKTIAVLKAQLVVAESAEAPAVTEESVPEMVADAIVERRLAKLDAARSDARVIAPEVKLDGLLSTRKIHEAAIKSVSPEMKLDGLSDDRVAGMFDALKLGAEKVKKADSKDGKDGKNDGKGARNDGLAAAHKIAAIDPNATDDDSAEAAFRKMREDSTTAWQRSKPALAVSTTIQAV